MASFRDPSGFVFRQDGMLLRQVNEKYASHFAALTHSGLYETLTENRLLVPHEVLDVQAPRPDDAHCVIRPELIPFISYPYEWCFGQLKAAALLTLEVQRIALAHNMVLKDASAFNIQFRGARPVLIDTLSFEVYVEGRPWLAYRQFCEHFLGPLLLMRDVDPWLGRLSALTVDGVPLEITSKLLPLKSLIKPSVQLHIHQHARLTKRYGGRGIPSRVEERGLSRKALTNLIEGLIHLVDGLTWIPEGTEWADYETEHGYTPEDFQSKTLLVRSWLQELKPTRVWDLGANTGEFSRIASESGAWVLAADMDPAAVERNYNKLSAASQEPIHPLVLDLRNPTPALGWALAERESIVQRANADVVLGLALVHHLAIGGNVPLPRIAEWFAGLAAHLIIEFVPKADPQVSRLLVSREDVFEDYTQARFEEAFRMHFVPEGKAAIGESDRVLYRYSRRTA